ncbi:hypothetical protein HGRIS_013212 [Hohenbuehelia grisea]|uniref:B30.2/SPRY domain-containing protein n=1 Tax=Hohenbuehelia grisea TaxID=104357 RepID=A0ABR3IUR6_9AGAR
MTDSFIPPFESASREGSSPPAYAPSPAPTNTHTTLASKTSSKKRKRATGPASSPVPPDSGHGGQPTPPPQPLLAGSVLADSCTIREPTFIPIAEGSEFCGTDQFPTNRMGYRYFPAGLNSSDGIMTFKTIETAPTEFRVSWEDRSPFVKVTRDGLGLLGDKGFRSARCNAPVREGCWYMEVKVECGGGDCTQDSNKAEGSHVRIGWGRREAPLNGPVGLDGYSYGVRDKTGEKVTLSRPRPYGKPFRSGDVIGMYIALPPRRKANKNDPHDPAHLKRQRIPIDLKSQAFFEALEYPQAKEMSSLMDYSGKSVNSAPVPSSSKKSATVKNLPERGRPNASNPEATPLRPLPVLPSSRIAFFVNGECQGIAFQDLYDYLPLRPNNHSQKKEKRRTREGAHEHRENPFDDGQLGYYPFISLFNDARVRLNPGPVFEYPPPPDIDGFLTGAGQQADSKDRTWRPMCERYREYMEEQWALDHIDAESAKVEAVKREAQEKAEADKKEHRRKQAEARRRKKLAAKQQVSTPPLDDDRFGPSATLNFPNVGQPSPLRYGVAYEVEEMGAEPENSPTPAFTPAPEPGGAPSGYSSDNGMDMDDAVGEPAESHHSPAPYLYQAKNFVWVDDTPANRHP